MTRCGSTTRIDCQVMARGATWRIAARRVEFARRGGSHYRFHPQLAGVETVRTSRSIENPY